MRPLQAHCHRGLGTLYATTGQQEQARTALSTADRSLPGHGDDVLAPGDRGGAGPGRGTLIVGEGCRAVSRDFSPKPVTLQA